MAAWAALRNGSGEDDEGAIAGADAGVVHVHGLGVNPKDGTLYAATHTGLFRIPEKGKAERVAGRWQDTMGFTVIGPDRFLGSGHPDLREMREKRLPPLLGLIESTDAGRSWTPRSLAGTADFHALRTSRGRVYGYNSSSGVLMVSIDGKTWETRSRLPIQDFAISPDNPDVIVAVTDEGLRRSGDGGRSWTSLDAPAVALLGWEAQGDLWGLAPDGTVYLSADGAGWQRRGTLGAPPAAFAVAGAALYAAAHDGGIYTSDDGGATWRLRYRDPAAGASGRQR